MAKKFVTGQESRAYVGGLKKPVVKKVVKYKCGCETTLKAFGQTNCANCCGKHGKTIGEVTTTEKFD